MTHSVVAKNPMVPKLIAVAGPLRGMVFDLNTSDTVIGRDPANSISLADKSLSRKHCLFRQDDDEVLVVDLESHNGTFVNDVPVKEHVLSHGDRVRVGRSHFLVLLREEEQPSPSDQVEFENDELLTMSVTKFRVEDALYSMAKDLNILTKVSSILSSIASFESLRSGLLNTLFEIVPAERGVIVLSERGVEETASVYAINKQDQSAGTIRISRTVANQVLTEGTAILSNEVSRNPAFANADSLIASQVRSLLCVPLILSGRVTGFIYLDTNRKRADFDEGHLRLMIIIGGVAAGALARAAETERLEIENRRLKSELRAGRTIVGESQPIRVVHAFIAKVAPHDSTVLILGESGTGKELVAREIHNASKRAAGPFVALNCASLNEALLESDLFGHEKGAFTGAITAKKGKLEVASGGTIFLDEVAEMSPSVQAKLLRVLQNYEFERVGSTRSTRSDVRVIAATNRDLKEAVRLGTFREDLYYRLNVVRVMMPSLRERREDITLLAKYFIARFAEKCKRTVFGLSTQVNKCLRAYDWPGNVRELENVIERAIVLGSSENIETEDLPEEIRDAAANVEDASDYQSLVKKAKQHILLNAIQSSGRNYAQAARSLGVHPNNLHRLLRSAGLKSPSEDSHA
jgi:transcriptional regulator with GAF, ATPase, and Fis domain